MEARPQRRSLEETNQQRMIFIRQRLDQSRVDETKDGDTRADAECQDKNRSHGKTGILAELTDGKTKILQHAFKPESDRFMTLVSQPRIVSKSPIGRMPRLAGRYAFGLQFALRQFAMEEHFFLQLAVELFAAHQNRYFSKEMKNRMHAGLFLVSLFRSQCDRRIDPRS